jgi:hypothetical protein
MINYVFYFNSEGLITVAKSRYHSLTLGRGVER